VRSVVISTSFLINMAHAETVDKYEHMTELGPIGAALALNLCRL
jgi:hypothetical protein